LNIATPQIQAFITRYLLPLVALAAAVFALYGRSLGNPIVFDDHGFFLVSQTDYLGIIFNFRVRWLPYATFEWTRYFFGHDVFWYRLGNIVLHALNGFLLFLLLRRLFALVLAGEGDAARTPWIAFFGALIFVLHPAAVYGVAYLIQRTILMATLFALLSLLLFVQGLERRNRALLWSSALAYLFAGLSKEHAILLPAVTLAMLLLLRPPRLSLFKEFASTLLLYAGAGAFIVYQVKAGNFIATAYEENSGPMLDLLGVDPSLFWPLSVITQSFLYFKYLLLWLLPDPSAMAIDMRMDFATQLWKWPETAGFFGFLLYGLGAFWLLLKRGRAGLLGFALLAPWLLFSVELSTVRIQEVFVIYRSYLWMPLLAAALPFLLQRFSSRTLLVVLIVMTGLFAVPAVDRLATFADPVLLWEDAMRLAKQRPHATTLGRIHHNRGLAYLNKQRYEEAIRDFNQGLQYLPQHSLIYNDRAVAYLETGRYMDALNDFDSAIRYDRRYYNPYLGRAKTYEALGNIEAARKDYEISCSFGVTEACEKVK
jgi:protein O-mannosyl-transferase